jgi:diguanylate cyclase (GGDEF)-like protein
LNVPICAVSLIDKERQWFKAYRGLGVSETARDISFCTHAIQQSTPYIVEDAANTPLFSANPLVTGVPNIGSYVGAQLKTKDGFNIGTLCAIDTKARVFSEAEIAILTQFANLVIADIEMREIASTDGLTGMMSRRAWLNCAEHEVHRAHRNNTPLAFFMIDIDHFKHVNDRFGHPVGDEVIKAVSRGTEELLRKSDWFGRYGGEEFVAILPGATLDDALVVAERMRAAVEAMRLPCLGDHRCTISIGVAMLEAEDAVPSIALERADHALFHAKQTGRNQVKAAQTAPTKARAAA